MPLVLGCNQHPRQYVKDWSRREETRTFSSPLGPFVSSFSSPPACPPQGLFIGPGPARSFVRSPLLSFHRGAPTPRASEHQPAASVHSERPTARDPGTHGRRSRHALLASVGSNDGGRSLLPHSHGAPAMHCHGACGPLSGRVPGDRRGPGEGGRSEGGGAPRHRGS